MYVYEVRFMKSLQDDDNQHIVFHVEAETNKEDSGNIVEIAKKAARSKNVDLNDYGDWTCMLRFNRESQMKTKDELVVHGPIK